MKIHVKIHINCSAIFKDNKDTGNLTSLNLKFLSLVIILNKMASFSTVKRKMERNGTQASYISNGIRSEVFNETATIYMVLSQHKTGFIKSASENSYTQKINLLLRALYDRILSKNKKTVGLQLCVASLSSEV